MNSTQNLKKIKVIAMTMFLSIFLMGFMNLSTISAAENDNNSDVGIASDLFPRRSNEDLPIDEDPEAIEDLKQTLENMDAEKIGNFIIETDKDAYGDESDVIERVVVYDSEKGIVPKQLLIYDIMTRFSVPLAKASGYYACFDKVEWINRNNVWSLSVYPHFAANGYSKDQAWGFLKEAHEKDYHWYNTDSMYHQFVCHYDWAGSFKMPWNLEPSKADKGYWGFVASGCN